MSSEGIISNELNTGIVIAGAYASKVRRSLFAQLSNIVRSNKNASKEVARASAELNWVLYRAIVESLKADKGDAVRVRIKYTYDPAQNKLEWDYDSLRVELFRRVPDGEVEEKVRETVKRDAEEARKRFSVAQPAESREVSEWEGEEEE